MIKEKLNKVIREIPDFPKPGINFKDITPILHQPELCLEIVKELKKQFKEEKNGEKPPEVSGRRNSRSVWTR